MGWVWWIGGVLGTAPHAWGRPTVPAAVPGPDGVLDWIAVMEGVPAAPHDGDPAVAPLPSRAEEHGPPAEPLVADVDPRAFDIPIESNELVQEWIRLFLGPMRNRMAHWLSAAHRYRPIMTRALQAENLPNDLVYVAMIESGFDTNARSNMRAVGLWQFIESTGREYGLRIDGWVDERQDPERASQAAAAYLADLYREFDDWPLAWAAYNYGPHNVNRAIREHGTRNYWTLVERRALPSQTRDYVPELMAAAIIGKNPERYGFTVIPDAPLTYDVASVDASMDVDILARCAGLDTASFRALNPALVSVATPPEGYNLRVPVGRSQRFLYALAKVPEAERLTVVVHAVRPDETLGGIAKRYNVSVEAVAAANRLDSPDRIEVGTRLVIPDAAPHAAVTLTEIAVAPRPKPPPMPSPAATPTRAPTPTPAPAPTRAPATAPVPARAAAPAPRVHVVVAGETLPVIAQTYGVSAAALKAINGLTASGPLVGGQTLRIPAAAPVPAATHTVLPGETLNKIASATGVSAAQLRAWNNIEDPDHIKVGQVLYTSGRRP